MRRRVQRQPSPKHQFGPFNNVNHRPFALNEDNPFPDFATIPDPDPYDGDCEALEGFVFKLRTKLRRNADWYDTEMDQVAYAVGRLKDKAERRILPVVQSESELAIETMEGFYKALQTTFTVFSSISSLDTKPSINIFNNTRPSSLKSVILREFSVETLQVDCTAWVTTCLPSLHELGKAGMPSWTVRQSF